ncbi:membrane-bound O-acyltransferase gup1-like isoform X3 [Salvia miltiorrhiza]|uniref:membrane-bound O-acyltransferase gup1-like isoform X3 n=1 Tax=Salvia miltiorrhiza TaxID=226208 RepID=UPI0025AD29BB|nr:membrane-bound O-acyltransferase gup1-like isoform X3 [Salvia miltiorrhiza]
MPSSFVVLFSSPMITTQSYMVCALAGSSAALFILFIFGIASANFFLVKIFGRTKYFLYGLWIFNLSFLVCNRIYEGYRFSSFGEHWAYLDDFRGTFRWHICFNFVVLRMISFGHDYHWTDQYSGSDHKKHIQRCDHCSTGKTCYLVLQERRVTNDKFSFPIYLCYLVYAPLYIAGPIISFNAFASQLDSPQNIYSSREVAWYGFRWVFCLSLMEFMTQFFYYNAFAISGLWKQLSPMDIFIIGYGVLNFMWLKFFLIWRYFRFWSLINGIVPPENMPRCINNCHNLESFWKNWHASFNKWLVRYVYIPLGGSQKKLLNVWVVFTFVAVWHDLEWKLLSWAWLTCIFFIPEMLIKSAANAFQVEGAFWEFIFRELSAVAGAVTITCLMVANLVGFVIGPSGVNWLVSGFLQEGGSSLYFHLMVYIYWSLLHFILFQVCSHSVACSFHFTLELSSCFTSLILSKGRTRVDDMKVCSCSCFLGPNLANWNPNMSRVTSFS